MGNTSKVIYAECVLVYVYFLSSSTFALSIPVLYTRGTHYEIGKDIGATFQKQIQGYFHHHRWLAKYFIPWYNTPQGRKIYNEYLSVAQSAYPKYVEEIQGVADGAKLNFTEVFLVNIDVELSALLDVASAVECCSTILVQHPKANQVLLGHNEDGPEPAKTRGYIVHAEVLSEDEKNVTEESFTAFAYPGKLPGNAFGFNNAGLIITINALYPKLVSTNKTARAFLTRAMLSAHNLMEVATIMKDVGRGTAYGFSANIGSLCERSGGKRQLWNWEVYPNINAKQSIVSFLHLGTRNSSNITNYFHVNTYRRMSVVERASHVMSSHHRSRRIRSLPVPRFPTDVLRVLGDTQDGAYPIYRHQSATDSGCTLATALFDMVQCTMAVYKSNPKSGHAPLHTFQLPC